MKKKNFFLILSSLLLFVNVSSGDDNIKIKTLQAPRRIGSIAFSPDSRILASGSNFRYGELPEERKKESYAYAPIFLWDVATGKIIRTLEGHTNSVTSLSFSSDGKILASGSLDSTIIFWDFVTGDKLRTLSNSGTATLTSFSHDGKLLVSKDIGITQHYGDEVIDIWDIAAGNKIRTFKFAQEICSISLSPDGKTLVTGANRHGLEQIIFRDINTGEKIRAFKGSCQMALSPDGKILASKPLDGAYDPEKIILMDSLTGDTIKTFNWEQISVKALKFSPDGKMLLILTEGAVTLLDVTTGKRIEYFGPWPWDTDSQIFSPDLKLLATIKESDKIMLYDWKLIALAKKEAERMKKKQLHEERKALFLKFLPRCNGTIIRYTEFFENPYKAKIGQCAVVDAKAFQMLSSNEGLFALSDWKYLKELVLVFIDFPKKNKESQLTRVQGIAKINGLYTYLTRAGLTKTITRLQWLENLSDRERQVISLFDWELDLER